MTDSKAHRLGARERVVSKRVVLEDVPVPKTRTRVHVDVPLYQDRNKGTFAKTALFRNHALKAFVTSRRTEQTSDSQSQTYRSEVQNWRKQSDCMATLTIPYR